MKQPMEEPNVCRHVLAYLQIINKHIINFCLNNNLMVLKSFTFKLQ